MSIGRSTALVSGLTFAGYLAGLAVQVVFALSFGAGPETDAWFAAVAVPNFLAAVLFASLAKAALPVFVRRREESDRAARRTATATVVTTWTGILLVTGIVSLNAPAVARFLYPSFDETRLSLSADLLGSAIWAVPAVAAAIVMGAELQSRRRFGQPAVAAVLQPVGILVCVALFGKVLGVRSMAVGLLAGSVAQMLVLVVPFLLTTAVADGSPFGDPGVREILRRVGPLMIAAALIAVYPLLEKSFGSRLPPGELSWIGYGRRPVMLLLFLVAAPVSITSFTAFAESAARGDHRELRDRAWRSAAALYLLVVPAAAFFLVHGESVIRALYERGAFTGADTAAAANVLLLLLPLAVCASAGKVLVHVFLARGRPLVPLLSAAAGAIVYVALAPALTKAYGHLGLAGLQSAAVGVSVGIAIAVLLVSYGRPKGTGVFRSALEITVAGAATAGVLWLTRGIVPGRNQSLAATLAVLLVTAGAAGGLYLGLLAIVRNATLAELIRSVAGRRSTSSSESAGDRS
jgi:putative peptidoglycan lipid II flippase